MGLHRLAVALTAFALISACSDLDDVSPTPSRAENHLAIAPGSSGGLHQIREACSGGRFRCFARVRIPNSDDNLGPLLTPQGYGAADLKSAYNFSTTGGSGQTVGIVGAYSYPGLESDLATYRSQYGLPPCTVASGCLTILNQEGQTSPLPGTSPPDDDWTTETALDTQMVSAACPNCKIVVAQADDDGGDGLLIVNSVLASHGATVISNSWGAPEQTFDPLSTADVYFNHAGIAIFASTGDSGYDDGGAGASYPATSQYVISVGGTTLNSDSTTLRGWTETAWSGGGASCSNLVAKPTWQLSGACGKRMTADMAAVGDPETGVAVFNEAQGGWGVVGGTSAASPLVAAMFAATGNGSATAQYSYANTTTFFDVTSGNDGDCNSVLCTAGLGWDGPTGNGTPNGAVLAGAKPPKLTISAPFEGAFVPPGFTVKAACSSADSATVKTVDFSVDDEALSEATAAPFAAAAPMSLAMGKHKVTVTCTVSTLARTTVTLDVMQAPACAKTTDCTDATDVCYNGACIAGPKASNGIGVACTGGSACASSSCAAEGSGDYCTVTCEPNGAACPSGFSCQSAGTSNICAPSTGGCNAGGDASLPWALLAAIGFGARRRWSKRS